ncbi:hypothetical protein LguiA_026314 [Lonicera macranthoides]
MNDTLDFSRTYNFSEVLAWKAFGNCSQCCEYTSAWTRDEFSCSCIRGFDGNPYLPNGSQGGHVEKTKLFSSKELKKATNDYNKSRIIGHGGQECNALLRDRCKSTSPTPEVEGESQTTNFSSETLQKEK